jgi:hypothetical protein
VALAAALCVEHGAHPVIGGFNLLEDEAIVIVGPQGHDGVLVKRLVVRPLVQVAVAEVVEAGRGFGDVARRRILPVAAAFSSIKILWINRAGVAKPLASVIRSGVLDDCNSSAKDCCYRNC